MKKHLLVHARRVGRAGLAAVSLVTLLTFGARDAAADTPNTPPPLTAPGATPTQPPAAQPAPSTAAPPPPGSGAVRVHLSTEKNKGTARLYIHQKDGYVLVCSSPCTADIPINSEMRVTLNNNDDEPHTFTITGESGPEIDLQVKPASLGPMIGGIVAMGAGGALALSGLLFLALAGLEEDTPTSGSTSTQLQKDTADTYRATGWVCIVLGGAAAVTGLVVLTTRSKEPRTGERPYKEQAPPTIYGRNETMLGDVAALRPREAMPFKPAFTPLKYGFTF
jgi:hypothetical protein